MGNSIVTEKLDDGSTTWEVNLPDVSVRNSLAKVFTSSECNKDAGVNVDEMNSRRSVASDATCKCYALGVYSLAGGEPIRPSPVLAFESYFMRHTLWKNSPVGREKRPFPFEVTARRKLSKVKSPKPVRLLKKQKSVSRRKVKGKQSKAKRKSKIKSLRKGSQSKNNKKNRRR